MSRRKMVTPPVTKTPEPASPPPRTLEQLLPTPLVTALQQAAQTGIYAVAILTMPTPLEVRCDYYPWRWPDAELNSAQVAFFNCVQERQRKLATRRS